MEGLFMYEMASSINDMLVLEQRNYSAWQKQ